MRELSGGATPLSGAHSVLTPVGVAVLFAVAIKPRREKKRRDEGQDDRT